MAKVPGIADLAVFKETGQPNLVISIDRAAAGRYGLMAADINAAVQAAIGGAAATQILEGDRRFDFVVRYKPEYRQNVEAMKNILLPTPDGNRVPLGQVAEIGFREGAFMIYRENGRRYIPIKFSVRGRDLAGTITDVQSKLVAFGSICQRATTTSGPASTTACARSSSASRSSFPITVGMILGLALRLVQFHPRCAGCAVGSAVRHRRRCSGASASRARPSASLRRSASHR